MYHEFKDIFEGNKQDFDGKGRPFTHFIAFEEHVVNRAVLQTVAKLSVSVKLSPGGKKLIR